MGTEGKVERAMREERNKLEVENGRKGSRLYKVCKGLG